MFPSRNYYNCKFRSRESKSLVLALRQISYLATGGFLTLILWTTLAIFLVIYISQITRSSTKGYTLKALNEQVENLKKDSKRLELEVASKESVAVIRARATALGMVPVGDISYIKDTGGAFARR